MLYTRIRGTYEYWTELQQHAKFSLRAFSGSSVGGDSVALVCGNVPPVYTLHWSAISARVLRWLTLEKLYMHKTVLSSGTFEETQPQYKYRMQ